MKYIPRSDFAGRIWLWAHQLNSLHHDEVLEIYYKGKSFKVITNKIKEVPGLRVDEKLNKGFDRLEKHYGFPINLFQ